MVKNSKSRKSRTRRAKMPSYMNWNTNSVLDTHVYNPFKKMYGHTNRVGRTGGKSRKQRIYDGGKGAKHNLISPKDATSYLTINGKSFPKYISK